MEAARLWYKKGFASRVSSVKCGKRNGRSAKNFHQQCVFKVTFENNFHQKPSPPVSGNLGGVVPRFDIVQSYQKPQK